MQNLGVSSVNVYLCNYHPDEDIVYYYHPRRIPMPFSSQWDPISNPLIVNPRIISLSILKLLKQNHSVFIFLYLASFA